MKRVRSLIDKSGKPSLNIGVSSERVKLEDITEADGFHNMNTCRLVLIGAKIPTFVTIEMMG